VGIAQAGKIVYEHGFGLANLTTQTAITPQTVFQVGSIAKQFTAAAILLLAQGGRLSLDDDIHRYLPELGDYGVTLRLRDLMWMESGLPDFGNLMIAAGFSTGRLTADDAIGVIAKLQRLEWPPGSQFEYSSTNYFLLRLVVERVSGRSLAAFARASIFDPLGMTGSSFQDGLGFPPSAEATGYQFLSGASAETDLVHWDLQGPAGLHTNVEDLLRWAANFRSGVVGGPAFVRSQLEGGPRPVPPAKFGDLAANAAYAAGLFTLTYKGDALILHTGTFEGFQAGLLIAPTDRIAVAMACNGERIDPDAYPVFAAWLGR
jgi:CubicO group peptidase (beta-lactamase class C family)